MGASVKNENHGNPGNPEYLKWYGAIAAGFAISFAIVGAWLATLNFVNPVETDFLSFWAAGRMVLNGHAALAYDIVAHSAVEKTIFDMGDRTPFPYPPPFLAIVTPFALTTFAVGFALWNAGTAAFYALVSSRVAPLRYAFGNASACINFMIGQTAFLICGIFIGGLTLVGSNPFVAGIILGLMVLKPQLAVILPIAMLAGREWRVITGAIVSTVAVLLMALFLFGLKSYYAFFQILPHYVELMRDSKWPWNELASPFALARYLGVPQAEAMGIHVVIAIAAATLTARAWYLKLDERVPILAAATMLISPYFFTYDALLIVIPIGWLVRQKRHPYVLGFTWLCCFIPVLTYFTPIVGPNFISVAAIACLWALHQPARLLHQRIATQQGEGACAI